MNTFTMKLQPNHFYYMKNGTKRIELRLNDEKRSKICIGDKIIFYKEPLLDESFETTVIKLLKYDYFENLIDDYGIEICADKNITKQDLLNDLEKFYTKEKQSKYGVLGIMISLN